MTSSVYQDVLANYKARSSEEEAMVTWLKNAGKNLNAFTKIALTPLFKQNDNWRMKCCGVYTQGEVEGCLIDRRAELILQDIQQGVEQRLSPGTLALDPPADPDTVSNAQKAALSSLEELNQHWTKNPWGMPPPKLQIGPLFSSISNYCISTQIQAEFQEGPNVDMEFSHHWDCGGESAHPAYTEYWVTATFPGCMTAPHIPTLTGTTFYWQFKGTAIWLVWKDAQANHALWNDLPRDSSSSCSLTTWAIEKLKNLEVWSLSSLIYTLLTHLGVLCRAAYCTKKSPTDINRIGVIRRDHTSSACSHCVCLFNVDGRLGQTRQFVSLGKRFAKRYGRCRIIVRFCKQFEK
jgi:hypothetical protein